MDKNIKIIVFILVILTLFILEIIIPKNKRVLSRKVRWSNNILVSLINRIFIKAFLLIPTLTFKSPLKGVINFIPLSPPVKIIVSFLILDFIIYFQHRIFHTVPILWAFHKMHHTEKDLDFTSALRFHPIELILSITIKTSTIWLLSIDYYTLLLFEIAISSFALFNHSNISIKPKIEIILKKVIITPDLHRIHHSLVLNECNSNFGTIFVLWDYIFNSLIKEPCINSNKMNIGLTGYSNNKYQYVHWMLITPFIKENN